MSDGHELGQSEVPAQLIMRFGLLQSRAVRVSLSPPREASAIPGTRGAMLRVRVEARAGEGLGSMAGFSGPVTSDASRGLFGSSTAGGGKGETLYGLVPDGNES
jgi:hypothetical protein